MTRRFPLAIPIAMLLLAAAAILAVMAVRAAAPGQPGGTTQSRIFGDAHPAAHTAAFLW